MNYGKYGAICCKRCFYLFICNELSCINRENQLLMIRNTMNIVIILQPSKFNVFLHGYFLPKYPTCSQPLIEKSMYFLLNDFNYKSHKNLDLFLHNGELE